MSSSINNFLTSNRFRLDYADRTGGPFRMRANITLLMRLIDNICANIVKHGSPSQPVELTASVEEDFLVLRESNAVLRKTVKTAAGDSGYGLVICEDVMSALGGQRLPRNGGRALLHRPALSHPAGPGIVDAGEKIVRSPLPTGERLLRYSPRLVKKPFLTS